MGSYWSSYAGTSDIASLATPVGDSEVREYDYIICGGTFVPILHVSLLITQVVRLDA